MDENVGVAAQVLAPGMRVRIQGLRGAPELNGLEVGSGDCPTLSLCLLLQ